MEIKPVWSEEVEVKTCETDFLGRWKPTAFFSSMEEAAVHHSSNLGFDYRDMMAKNCSWILSRMKIQFDVFPKSGERITVETWPKGIQQKLLFLRDYWFYDSSGRRIASATSAWLLVDIVRRHFLLPQALGGDLPDNPGRSALDDALDKIALPENLERQHVAAASYSSVDLMGHVNNTRYIDWVTDCFDFEAYRSRSLDTLQINYQHEVKPGQQVDICCVSRSGGQDSFLVCGINQETNASAFEAAITWKA